MPAKLVDARNSVALIRLWVDMLKYDWQDGAEVAYINRFY